MSPEGATDRFSLGAGRPRPPYQPKAIKCANCGSPLAVKNEASQLVVCDYCGSHLDVGAEEQQILGSGGDAKWTFPLALGDSFRFKAVRYEVVARMAFIEDGDPTELTRQYMLYHPRRGSLWLDEYQGHYSISESTHLMPRRPALSARRGDTIETHDNRSWVCEGSGVYELVWVDGALPWLARPGDRIHYAEFVDPDGNRLQYDVTAQGHELEYGIGEALPIDEVRRALGKQDLAGATATLPNAAKVKRGFRGIMALAAILLLVNGLVFLAAAAKGKTVLRQSFSAQQLTEATLSEPFQVEGDGDVVKIACSCPQLDNAWMAVDLAVVKGEDSVIHATDADVEYYHGRDSEGSWSEGSRSKSVYVKVPEAGQYRLLVQAVSDRSGVAESAQRAEHDLSVKVIDGAAMPIYPVLAGVFSLAVLVMTAAAYHKWRNEDEDDE